MKLIDHLKTGLPALAILGACTSLSCEETLPPRDLRDFLSPVFRASETADVIFAIEDDTLLLAGAFFAIGLKNNSDEYLQSKAKINGMLEVASPDDPSFHKSFEFTVPQLAEVTIKPLSEFTVSAVWDQRDDSCRYVFRNMELEPLTIGRAFYWATKQMLTFKVKGKVQFWPNVETKGLPEITIRRRYMFRQFDPRPDFMNSRSCRQFRGSLF